MIHHMIYTPTTKNKVVGPSQWKDDMYILTNWQCPSCGKVYTRCQCSGRDEQLDRCVIDEEIEDHEISAANWCECGLPRGACHLHSQNEETIYLICLGCGKAQERSPVCSECGESFPPDPWEYRNE